MAEVKFIYEEYSDEELLKYLKNGQLYGVALQALDYHLSPEEALSSDLSRMDERDELKKTTPTGRYFDLHFVDETSFNAVIGIQDNNLNRKVVVAIADPQERQALSLVERVEREYQEDLRFNPLVDKELLARSYLEVARMTVDLAATKGRARLLDRRMKELRGQDDGSSVDLSREIEQQVAAFPPAVAARLVEFENAYPLVVAAVDAQPERSVVALAPAIEQQREIDSSLQEKRKINLRQTLAANQKLLDEEKSRNVILPHPGEADTGREGH